MYGDVGEVILLLLYFIMLPVVEAHGINRKAAANKQNKRTLRLAEVR